MPEHYTPSIIRALRAERRRRGLSQTEVGRRIGRPKSRISEIENGKTRASFSTVEDYAASMGLRFALIDDKGTVVRPGQITQAEPDAGTVFDDVFVPDPENEDDDAPRP